ncbi:MAG: family 43 glycosylhydrolase [Clostridia bacterium]|nr:family 43 glycosylhydrolase [Clostridia bacterium]
MIETGIFKLRDPFVLAGEDCYYLYGTDVSEGGWNDTAWGCYKSEGKNLSRKWEKTKNLVYIRPENAEKQFWAPEVHKFNGSYYMIASYYSSLTGHRGCSILKSESPEGPFVEITNGHITPKEWDSIDGTFWVDDEEQPWMVFVHEWTCTDDGIGRMAAAKLSLDLTHFISEPMELFRADDAHWANKQVTDGCFLYKTSEGRLLMLWSNTYNDEYRVGIAYSKNGKVDGEWIQAEEPLFTKAIGGKYDGGHGMLFTAYDGQMYLSVHSPNNLAGGLSEEAIFLPVEEKNGLISCTL